MATYTIKQDGGIYNDIEGLDEAIGLAEELLGGADSEATTFTVENEDGYLLAVLNKGRRIEGTFTKQTWGGRKGDDAIFIGDESFDATDAVLMMKHSELVALQDSDESTDEIGRNHVGWDGPCEVSLVDSICAYFGVFDLSKITPEALAFARGRANPTPSQQASVDLKIQVSLNVAGFSSVEEFLQAMEVNVISKTAGVRVTGVQVSRS